MTDKCKPIEMIAGGSTVLLGRIYGTDGNLLTQADISSTTLNYRDVEVTTDTGTDVTLNFSADSYLYDTLQTDAVWTDSKDSTGYNFKYVLSGVLTTYNTTYWVEVAITETTGDVIKFGWYIKTIGR